MERMVEQVKDSNYKRYIHFLSSSPWDHKEVNGPVEQHSAKEWAYFQCSRYRVERCFNDSKNELGISGYQMIGWLAWQHHMALVMMAGFYVLKTKLENQSTMPLLSVRDARLLVIALNFATQKEVDLCMDHIRKRHSQRQKDIDKYY